MSIRTVAKAIIIHNNKVLLNKCQNTLGNLAWGLPNGTIYYDLPGGGQDKYETLEETIKRETLEETGYAIAVGRLAAIYEDIIICDETKMNEPLRQLYQRHSHKIHFIFICHLANETAQPSSEFDTDMLCCEWVNLTNIKTTPLYPQPIHSNFDLILNSQSTIFLGSNRISL